jgi:hypothetical protein
MGYLTTLYQLRKSLSVGLSSVRYCFPEETNQDWSCMNSVRSVRKLKPLRGENIKMDLTDIWYTCAYWIHLAPDRDQWLAPVNMAMNFLDPTEWWEFLVWLSNYWPLKEDSAASSNWTCGWATTGLSRRTQLLAVTGRGAEQLLAYQGGLSC